MGLLRRSLELGLGALMLTKEAADELLDEAAAEDDGGDSARAREIVAELRERGRKAREELAEGIRREVDAVLERGHLVRREEYDALLARVEALEARLGMTPAKPQFESAPDL
jgi:polyhydroxyalkanoate synthesis regulator phasin